MDEVERLRAALERIVMEYEPGYAAWDFVGIAKRALRHHLWGGAVGSGVYCVGCGLAVPASVPGVYGECPGGPMTSK